ncbi:MAG: hypothetical protein COA78_26705 [Blastopirellula sp.]|nr:MAG: hypothetical protein COA78_26705 [Blastopirellula sp.]
MNGPKVRFWLGIALAGFHLGISILFVLYGRTLFSPGNDIGMLIVMTLIFVQSSLLATWAMLGGGYYWIRIPLSFLLLLWSGYSFLFIGPTPNQNEIYVSIGIMMLGQFFIITWLIFVLQIVLKVLKLDSHLDSSTRFSMGSMLIAVSLIAVTIGTGRLLVQQLGLTMEVFENPSDGFWAFPFLGLFNAIVVVIMLPALWVYRWKHKIILAISLLFIVGITGVIEDQIFRYFFNNRPPWYIFIGLSLGQAILFFITVFPLWRWKTMSEPESPEIETDALGLEGVEE